MFPHHFIYEKEGRKEGIFPSQTVTSLSCSARVEQLNLNTTSKEDHARICLSGCDRSRSICLCNGHQGGSLCFCICATAIIFLGMKHLNFNIPYIQCKTAYYNILTFSVFHKLIVWSFQSSLVYSPGNLRRRGNMGISESYLLCLSALSESHCWSLEGLTEATYCVPEVQ